MHRTALAFALLLTAGGAHAAKDPVSVGGGVYMLTDRNFTIFGSADGIVAKLMTQANKFCGKKGGEAEMVDSAGSESVPGQLKNGQLQRAAQGATGTVYFRCAGAQSAVEPASSKSAGRFLQFREYGDVTVQMSLPDDEMCAALAKSAKNSTCAATSVASAMRVRAVLEEPESKDIITVDSVGANTCSEFVNGIKSTSGLSVLQDCREK